MPSAESMPGPLIAAYNYDRIGMPRYHIQSARNLSVPVKPVTVLFSKLNQILNVYASHVRSLRAPWF